MSRNAKGMLQATSSYLRFSWEDGCIPSKTQIISDLAPSQKRVQCSKLLQALLSLVMGSRLMSAGVGKHPTATTQKRVRVGWLIRSPGMRMGEIPCYAISENWLIDSHSVYCWFQFTSPPAWCSTVGHYYNWRIMKVRLVEPGKFHWSCYTEIKYFSENEACPTHWFDRWCSASEQKNQGCNLWDQRYNSRISTTNRLQERRLEGNTHNGHGIC